MAALVEWSILAVIKVYRDWMSKKNLASTSGMWSSQTTENSLRKKNCRTPSGEQEINPKINVHVNQGTTVNVSEGTVGLPSHRVGYYT
ncbi:hypothetical protein TNCV_4918671 [Trichonephila clavipes]|nr:hypothetical protein TNCV_4918671 [Trichonephila clavipes]